MLHPVFLNHSPQPDFIGAMLDAPIFFRVEDFDGLNTNTLTVKVNNDFAIIDGVYQTGWHGTITNEDHTPNKISVVIVKDTLFLYGQEIQIRSGIDDQIGNHGNDWYHFITVPDPDVDPPVVAAHPHGNTFNTPQSVQLLTDDVQTVIYYTVNGSTPNLSSPIYSSPILINFEGKTVVKFIGVDQNNNSTPIIVEEYVIDTTAPITQAIPPSGNFFDSQNIKLITNDATATTYFTTNGANPTNSSSIYTTPIKLKDNVSTTIKFFSVDKAGNQESIKVETYNIEIAKNNYIPTNIFVTCPFNQNILDVRWDDMHPIWTKVIGYNVYRAHVETGPYCKLNTSVLTVNQYQDKLLDTQIIKEDVSEQFRRTVNISKQVNDDFQGPNFDFTKWIETDGAELLFQYNGVNFLDKVGLTQESKLTSIFKMHGNFDIEIKYDLLTWLQPQVGIESCMFRVKRDDTNYIQISRDRSNSINAYTTNRFFGGNPDLPITNLTIDAYGSFRITRQNDIVTTYFVDNATQTFITMGSYQNFVDDVYIEILGRSVGTPIEVRWSSFKVNSGYPIIIEPLNPLYESKIQVSKIPIVDSTGNNKPTDKVEEVFVTINGKPATVKKVWGIEGVIELETKREYDEIKRQWVEPIKPDEHSVVLVNYKTKQHTTNIRMRKNYFYKVTSVTNEDETDIDLVPPEYLKPEKSTYIWDESVRRNAWLLDQAGERVMLYLRKRAGKICHCTYRDLKERTHKAPDKDCPQCWGSSFVGGFEGPFPIIIAPLTTEQKIQQNERGLKLAYQIETWMGPSPIIAQRDLILRRNGDRCLVGPVTPVEASGGVMVQQHFTIEFIDSTDIRYTFPVQPLPQQYEQPSIDKQGVKVPEIDSPREREDNITSLNKVNPGNRNVDHIVRGRSMTFENTEY